MDHIIHTLNRFFAHHGDLWTTRGLQRSALSKSRGWLNQRVLAVLQALNEAKQFHDYPRISYLQQETYCLDSPSPCMC